MKHTIDFEKHFGKWGFTCSCGYAEMCLTKVRARDGAAQHLGKALFDEYLWRTI